MDKLPSISVVIATFNSQKTLEVCLKSVCEQEYPTNLIEIIIADGGSSDKTINIAKSYGAKVISIISEKQGAEYNRAVGINRAKNEIIAILDHDNILPHKVWLKKMVRPFREDKTMVGVETLRYHYNKNDTLLGRYFSLLGANDVLPFYLGKADRLSYMYDRPKEYGFYKKLRIEEKKDYFVVHFSPNAIPTLGSNGFLIRRKLLLEESNSSPENFFHIDVNVDLINKGFTVYALIKDSLIHKTQERGVLSYLRRRGLFMEKYYLDAKIKRRYSVYERRDLFSLIKFIFISITIVKPLYDSVRGYIKKHDIAWFLHPVMCLGTTCFYGYTFLSSALRSRNVGK